MLPPRAVRPRESTLRPAYRLPQGKTRQSESHGNGRSRDATVLLDGECARFRKELCPQGGLACVQVVGQARGMLSIQERR